MTKRSASELWSALEDLTIENEMDAVLAMTPEERRRELIEAGFDLEEVHAQADALWAKMGIELASAVASAKPAPVERVVTLRPKRRRLAVALPLAAALAAGVVLLVKNALSPAVVGAPRPYEPPAVRARALRDEARDGGASRKWQTCLDDLNEAKGLDPEGDEAPEVQALRRSISEPAGGP